MFQKLQKALDTGLFQKDLCDIPPAPSLANVRACNLPLSPEHSQLLLEWGGANLDEIKILDLQSTSIESGLIKFATDYNGFTYSYDQAGQVIQTDSDGGAEATIASSISEFINDVFLGHKSQQYYGEEWHAELKERGLL